MMDSQGDKPMATPTDKRPSDDSRSSTDSHPSADVRSPEGKRPSEDKRLFLALLPDAAAREALVATQELVAPHLAKPKPTAPGNLHITLAFLGMCDAYQEAAAAHALEEAAAECAPFDLALGTLGCFEKKRGGSIVWRGVGGDTDALLDLHDELVDALADEGFELEGGPYIPHITLFRGARPATAADAETDVPLAETLYDLGEQLGDGVTPWPVRAASLMWSHRPEDTGLLTYGEIARVELATTIDAAAGDALASDGIAQADAQARPRTLFIDADACPVTREAIDCARKAHMPVVIAGNTTQNLEHHIRPDDPRRREDARRGFWVDTLDVSIGSDSADFAIVERLAPGDVVVTQDIGLASMVLGRGGAAIGVRGHIYRRETIDSALLIRHEEKKVRRAGGRTGGPAKFTGEDRRRFKRNLMRILRGE